MAFILDTMNRPRILAILNLLGGLLVLVLNTLANTLPINGYNTGQISRMYPNLFVPAGFTFSIWSVIYLLMLGFMATSIKWMWHRPDSTNGKVAAAVSPWFLASCLANSAWIMAWHYLQVGLSVCIMVAFLAGLIMAYHQLQADKSKLSGAPKVFLYHFFIVYLGWISVAAIANITAWLVSLKWGGFGLDPAFWSLTLIAIAIVLGLLFIANKRDHAYAWVIAWALFGIYAEQSMTTPVIGSLALGGIIVLLLFSATYLLFFTLDRR